MHNKYTIITDTNIITDIITIIIFINIQLLYFIENHLSAIGIVLLASKRFYFGVGGGTYLIETIINNKYSTLNYKLLQTYENGYSNIREIVMISRKIQNLNLINIIIKYLHN